LQAQLAINRKLCSIPQRSPSQQLLGTHDKDSDIDTLSQGG
jgi:hypothetical protein